MEYLIFKIVNCAFGVKNMFVSKIVHKLMKEEHNSKSWMLGYISMNGKKIAILDMAFLLGMSMHRQRNGSIHPFILFRYDENHFGIMADEILGKVSASVSPSSTFKTLYGPADPRVIAGNISFNGQDVAVLNEDFLIPPSYAIPDFYSYPSNFTATNFFPSYWNKTEEKQNFLAYGSR